MTRHFEGIEESKKRERRRLAALPFAEKLRLLEKLRDREAALIAGRVCSPPTGPSDRILLAREHLARYQTTTENTAQHSHTHCRAESHE